MYDGLDEIVITEEFTHLLAKIDKMAGHHDQRVLDAAADKPIEQLRYIAGQANGIRLVYDMLHKARKAAKE